MCFEFLDKHTKTGFLVLRLGLGTMFMWHGYGKLSAGPAVWEKVGMALSYLGIDLAPKFFGLMAALTEFGGGICLILGLLFRPACLFLFIVMAVASSMHLGQGDGLKGASHAIELGIVFFSLMFIGPGPISLDAKLRQRQNG